MGKRFTPSPTGLNTTSLLINRGSLTFWVDAETMNNWFHHDHHGRRGAASFTLTRPSVPS